MALDPGTTAALVSVVGGTITVAGTVFTAVRSGKDKTDRQVDRNVGEETAKKIRAEREQITEETRLQVLRDLREALDDAKKNLEDTTTKLQLALKESEVLRLALKEKNDQIDHQNRMIGNLTRRAEVLENWIHDNQDKFNKVGIPCLPEDAGGDRDHSIESEDHGDDEILDEIQD